MKHKRVMVLQLLIFICSFFLIKNVSVKADVTEPYFSTQNVHINGEGYADVNSIYINSNGAGSISVRSATEWIYISNDNINFYNKKRVTFDEENCNLYFRITMNDTDCIWRKSFVYINFKDIDKDYFITFTKYFEPEAFKDSDYDCIYDVLYINSSEDNTTSDSQTADNQPEFSSDDNQLFDNNSEYISISDSSEDNTTNDSQTTDNQPGFSSNDNQSFDNNSEYINVSDLLEDNTTNDFQTTDNQPEFSSNDNQSFDNNLEHIQDNIDNDEIDYSLTDKTSYLNISVSNITVAASGKASVSRIDVDTDGTGGFSVFCSADWIEIDESISDGYFYVSFDRNASYETRLASIIVYDSEGPENKKICVEQSGTEAFLSVNKTEVSMENNGYGEEEDRCIEVITKGTGSFRVFVEDNCGWIRLSDDPKDDFMDSLVGITLNNDSNIWISVSENAGSSTRIGTVKIEHESGKIYKTVTIVQGGSDLDAFEVSTEYVQFDSSASGIELIKVYAGDNLKWMVTSESNWIYVRKQDSSKQKNCISETGSSQFYIYIKANKSSKARDGYIRLSAKGFEDIEIFVSQPAREKVPGELLQGLSVSLSKKMIYVNQMSKVRFQYPEGMYATDVKKVRYSSNKKKVATVSKGVIKGKKKGKAFISVKVTTTDNTVKTFKMKIVVDKRLSPTSV